MSQPNNKYPIVIFLLGALLSPVIQAQYAPIAHGTESKRGRRSSMEDAHFPQKNNLCTINNNFIYGVFDGHGDRLASNFSANNFLKYLTVGFFSSTEGTLENTPEINCVIFESVYIEDMSTTSWRDRS